MLVYFSKLLVSRPLNRIFDPWQKPPSRLFPTSVHASTELSSSLVAVGRELFCVLFSKVAPATPRLRQRSLTSPIECSPSAFGRLRRKTSSREASSPKRRSGSSTSSPGKGASCRMPCVRSEAGLSAGFRSKRHRQLRRQARVPIGDRAVATVGQLRQLLITEPRTLN